MKKHKHNYEINVMIYVNTINLWRFIISLYCCSMREAKKSGVNFMDIKTKKNKKLNLEDKKS